MARQRFPWSKKQSAPSDLVLRSGLPSWIVRLLWKSGIKRVSMIAEISDQQLLEIPGIGRRAVAMIREEIGQRQAPGAEPAAPPGPRALEL